MYSIKLNQLSFLHKITQHDLLNLDFEGILTYFRASLPKKFGSEEEAKGLFNVAKSFQKVHNYYFVVVIVVVVVVTQITQKKLRKLEKDYQFHLDQLALLEDPSVRMEVV